MTAGRSAGTEQGQGREVVHACPEGASGFTACCNRTPFELDPMSRMTVDPALVTCSPSVPPARGDSGRGEAREFPQSFSAPPRINEAREAVARWLAGFLTALRSGDRTTTLGQAADDLLSLPELAALLRDGTTT